MPAIVLFGKHWKIGSDDIVIPALFLFFIHLLCMVGLVLLLTLVNLEESIVITEGWWVTSLRDFVISQMVLLSGSIVLEGCAVFTSARGNVLQVHARAAISYIIYIRLGWLLLEFTWQMFGVVLITLHLSAPMWPARCLVLLFILVDWILLITLLASLGATMSPVLPNNKKSTACSATNYDVNHSNDLRPLCSNSSKAGEDPSASSTNHTLHPRLLFLSEDHADLCCRHRTVRLHSYTELAALLNRALSDLDLVNTDMLAALLLCNYQQKLERQRIVSESIGEIYQYLSGHPVSPSTKFLSLKAPDSLASYKRIVYYSRVALAVRRWARDNSTLGLSAIGNSGIRNTGIDVNAGSGLALSNVGSQFELLYCSQKIDHGTGVYRFFIGFDHSKGTAVLTICSKLCFKNLLSLLSVEEREQIPVTPSNNTWYCNKALLQIALAIKSTIEKESLLFFKKESGTQRLELIVVGHSMAGGVAVLLSILLNAEMPNIQCYAYSPPNNLLSARCADDTRDLITTVIVGQDVVPRITSHQLSSFRDVVIDRLRSCPHSKWKIICNAGQCCGPHKTAASHNGGLAHQLKSSKDKSAAVFTSTTAAGPVKTAVTGPVDYNPTAVFDTTIATGPAITAAAGPVDDKPTAVFTSAEAEATVAQAAGPATIETVAAGTLPLQDTSPAVAYSAVAANPAVTQAVTARPQSPPATGAAVTQAVAFSPSDQAAEPAVQNEMQELVTVTNQMESANSTAAGTDDIDGTAISYAITSRAGEGLKETEILETTKVTAEVKSLEASENLTSIEQAAQILAEVDDIVETVGKFESPTNRGVVDKPVEGGEGKTGGQARVEREVRIVIQPSVDEELEELCLPANIIHVVRNHPKDLSRCCKRRRTVFQPICSTAADFSTLLVSRVMFSDHLLHNIVDALSKVLTRVSPAKPVRKPERVSRRYESPTTTSEPTLQSEICAPFHPQMISVVNRNAVNSELVYNSLVQPIAIEAGNVAVNRRRMVQERRQFSTVLCNPMLLDLQRQEDPAAPLASPEVYSETSSLASIGSDACGLPSSWSGGLRQQRVYRRLVETAPRMEAIEQSPLNASYLKGLCQMAGEPDVEAGEGALKRAVASKKEGLMKKASFEHCDERRSLLDNNSAGGRKDLGRKEMSKSKTYAGTGCSGTNERSTLLSGDGVGMGEDCQPEQFNKQYIGDAAINDVTDAGRQYKDDDVIRDDNVDDDDDNAEMHIEDCSQNTCDDVDQSLKSDSETNGKNAALAPRQLSSNTLNNLSPTSTDFYGSEPERSGDLQGTAVKVSHEKVAGKMVDDFTTAASKQSGSVNVSTHGVISEVKMRDKNDRNQPINSVGVKNSATFPSGRVTVPESTGVVSSVSNPGSQSFLHPDHHRCSGHECTVFNTAAHGSTGFVVPSGYPTSSCSQSSGFIPSNSCPVSQGNFQSELNSRVVSDKNDLGSIGVNQHSGITISGLEHPGLIILEHTTELEHNMDKGGQLDSCSSKSLGYSEEEELNSASADFSRSDLDDVTIDTDASSANILNEGDLLDTTLVHDEARDSNDNTTIIM